MAQRQRRERAYCDYLAGRPAADPALIAMTFSAVDGTLAPPDKHVLFLWGQYFPYEVTSGESWNDIGDQVADRMLAKLAAYAPNVNRRGDRQARTDTPLVGAGTGIAARQRDAFGDVG